MPVKNGRRRLSLQPRASKDGSQGQTRPSEGLVYPGVESPPPDPQDLQAFQRCRECLVALAHRLSQPLTALRGSIELALLKQRSAAQYRTVLEQSLGLADELVRLITALRDLAESVGLTGPPERVLLCELVGEVREDLRAMAESQQVQTKIESSGQLYVRANRGILRQAILRLLHRALVDAPTGATVQVSVSGRSGNACLTFSHPCRDNPTCELKPGGEISTPGGVFSEAAKGSGLDWAIAQSLIDAMGGSLEVENAAAEERRFHIRVLLADASNA